MERKFRTENHPAKEMGILVKGREGGVRGEEMGVSQFPKLI
jgi:hypothetical protein